MAAVNDTAVQLSMWLQLSMMLQLQLSMLLQLQFSALLQSDQLSTLVGFMKIKKIYF